MKNTGFKSEFRIFILYICKIRNHIKEKGSTSVL